MMSIMGMMLQIMQMLMMLLGTFLQGGMGGGLGSGMGGDSSGSDPSFSSGSDPYSGSGGGAPASPYTQEPNGMSPDAANSPGSSTGGDSGSATPGGGNPMTSGSNGKSNADVGSSDGWDKNVNVFCTVHADQASAGTATTGYWSSMKQAFNSGASSLRDAHDSVNLDYQQTIRTNAPENSFVKGGGGKILVVGGDSISAEECQQHAADLKKAFGVDVEVVPNCSPAKLKAKLQEMGQGSGQQVLVDILAHGAKDDSGKNNGNMALGKDDGDQWLHEDALKSMVNQYLAPKYKNVNLLIESCYSGNFVQ